jgi:hypothetical protein
MITETDEVAAALRAAAVRWPEARERPTRLLAALIREGHRTIESDREHVVADRRAAIRETKGALSGSYPPGYLEQLRRDWPE